MWLTAQVLLVASAALGQPKTVFSEDGVGVRQSEIVDRETGAQLVQRTLLVHGVHFGSQYQADANQQNGERINYRRLPATYYHPHGPAGILMGRLNWFGSPIDRGGADSRLPASTIGLSAGGNLLCQVAALWSEPPFAIVGIEAGVPGAYARPLQTVDVYEENPTLLKVSFSKDSHFTYLLDARKRGAHVRTFEGPRRTMLHRAGIQGFYRCVIVETYHRNLEEVDTLLLTKQGMELLMGSTVSGGVVAYHVSNRYYDLTPVVADVAKSLGYAWKQGNDNASGAFGHFSSRWVMVARSPEDLAFLKEPVHHRKQRPPDWPAFWTTPEATGRFLWTDEEITLRGLQWQERKK